MSYKKNRRDPYELFFRVNSKRPNLNKAKKFQKRLFLANVDQRWIARKNSWKIDTTITPEIKNLLGRIKKSQKKGQKYWKDGGLRMYEFAPRVMTDLSIIPNFAHDNFTMNFSYRDTSYSLPVVASFGGSVRKIQARERNNYKEYERKVKEAKAEELLIETYKDQRIAAQAKLVREQRATFLANFPDYEKEQREYLRFGMSSFGLINCDYFSRNIPDGYIALDTLGIDQNGEFVRVPNDIRNIYLDDNSFVSTMSDNVPVYKERKSIILFAISAVEVAIIKGWTKLKNGFSQPNVVRISTKGLTPSQVKDKILSIE
jgi:hypothetical protein